MSKPRPTSAPRSHRLKTIEGVITAANLRSSWRDAVRQGLRGQIIKDLHDYLDVHRQLNPIVDRIRALVLSGRFRVSPPEIVTLEKNLGVCRRLVIPTPTDAILLQSLVRALEPAVKQAAPSAAAYYSRSHSGPRVDDVDESFPYPWWELWPAFQRRILEFSESHDFIVIADIANYFDTIPLNRLRNAVAGLSHFEEPLLDLLFFLLEAFVWRPQYVPHSNVGLPQIDFDAPRLLAYAYLFPIDRLLAHQTNGAFVRWMDDIDFGVHSKEEGKVALRALDEHLAQLGVRLNSAKTKLHSQKDAAKHFWVADNRALTVIQNAMKFGSGTLRTKSAQRARLRSSFAHFAEKPQVGNWDKVMKRYLTSFGRLRDPLLLRFVPDLLATKPALRPTLFRYLLHLGYERASWVMVASYVRSQSCTDDASLFDAIQVLVMWRVPAAAVADLDAVGLASAAAAKREGGGAGIAAGLWLLAKYARRDAIESYLNEFREAWTLSDWVARQVASIFPLISPSTQSILDRMFFELRLSEAATVSTHWRQLADIRSLDPQLERYLTHPPHVVYSYPLPKAIIARVVLGGKLSPPDRARLLKFVRESIDDEMLRSLIFGRLQPTAPTDADRASSA